MNTNTNNQDKHALAIAHAKGTSPITRPVEKFSLDLQFKQELINAFYVGNAITIIRTPFPQWTIDSVILTCRKYNNARGITSALRCQNLFVWSCIAGIQGVNLAPTSEEPNVVIPKDKAEEFIAKLIISNTNKGETCTAEDQQIAGNFMLCNTTSAAKALARFIRGPHDDYVVDDEDVSSKSPLEALGMGPTPFRNCTVIMRSADAFLADQSGRTEPDIVELLSHIVETSKENKLRLVLLAGPDFVVPKKLQHIVSVIDHTLPDRKALKFFLGITMEPIICNSALGNNTPAYASYNYNDVEFLMEFLRDHDTITDVDLSVFLKEQITKYLEDKLATTSSIKSIKSKQAKSATNAASTPETNAEAAATQAKVNSVYDTLTFPLTYNKVADPETEEEKFAAAAMEELISLLQGMTTFEAIMAVRKCNIAIAPLLEKGKTCYPVEVAQRMLDISKELLAAEKTAIVKRTKMLTVMPSLPENQIGGMAGLKKWLHIRRKAFSKEAREVGVDAPKGIALIGPPGTGKSVAAGMVSHIFGLPLIKVDIASVFSSLVGSSEENVRLLLYYLKSIAPCVAFIDEIDKAGFGGSVNTDSGVTNRVLGTLLTHMAQNDDNIFWVFTANRASMLPPELLRKGRLDELFVVNLPTLAEKVEIMNIHLKKRKETLLNSALESIAQEWLADFTSSEIETVIAEAKLRAYNADTHVTAEHLISVAQTIHPIANTAAMRDDIASMTELAKSVAQSAN